MTSFSDPQPSILSKRVSEALCPLIRSLLFLNVFTTFFCLKQEKTAIYVKKSSIRSKEIKFSPIFVGCI
jgi:hypothetical protein